MSITHPATGPVIEPADYEAAHTIANGTVTVAQLSATGSPSSANYLRGDGSWATPSAGATIQYPGLKPATPTDDFTGSSLSGWTAHSSVGSFALGDCFPQGWEWGGSALEMQFSGQMGCIYRAHGNGDLDFQAGGMISGHMNLGQNMMFGIAALDSAGTGIGVISYNDGSTYLVSITTWQYASNTASWANSGYNPSQVPGHISAPTWFRLTRVSGTWTGYVSLSGRVWDHTFATRADSVTVDKVALGLFLDTGASPAYYGRLTADYFDVAV